jgi:hypothetical protein
MARQRETVPPPPAETPSPDHDPVTTREAAVAWCRARTDELNYTILAVSGPFAKLPFPVFGNVCRQALAYAVALGAGPLFPQLGTTTIDDTMSMSDALCQVRLLVDWLAAEGAPTDDGGPPCRFEWGGDSWHICFEGKAKTLRDSKGLRCIARLLQNLHRSIDAITVEGGGPSRPGAEMGLDDALDPTTEENVKNSLREVLYDLGKAEKELNEAVCAEAHDLEVELQEEYDRLVNKRNQLVAYLNASRGVHGRKRKVGSTDQRRAHDRVEKALKVA